MYFIGLTKIDLPNALINPEMCRTLQELHTWLTTFLGKDEFRLSEVITLESLSTTLESKKPVRINIEGFKVAILLGEEDIIQSATERFVHVMGLNIKTTGGHDIESSILRYVN